MGSNDGTGLENADLSAPPIFGPDEDDDQATGVRKNRLNLLKKIQMASSGGGVGGMTDETDEQPPSSSSAQSRLAQMVQQAAVTDDANQKKQQSTGPNASADPSEAHLAQLEAEYSRGGQPAPKPSLKQKILSTALKFAPIAAGAALGGGPGAVIGAAKAAKGELNREQTLTEKMREEGVSRQNTLAQQIEAEKGRQETEAGENTRAANVQSGDTLRARMQEQSAQSIAESNQQAEMARTVVSVDAIGKTSADRAYDSMVKAGMDPAVALKTVTDASQKGLTLEQTAEQAYLKGDMATYTQMKRGIQDLAAAKQAPERPPQTMMIDPTTGRAMVVRPGDQVAPGSVTPTQAGATNAAENKLTESAQDDINFADTYLKSGKFTGPADELLVERFFDLAKPSSGFRMSQPQIDLLMNARSWMDSLKGKAYHAKTGQWFPPDQRQQIVDSMHMRADTMGGKSAPRTTPQAGSGGGTSAGRVLVEGKDF